jgi:hypothetical protein
MLIDETLDAMALSRTAQRSPDGGGAAVIWHGLFQEKIGPESQR